MNELPVISNENADAPATTEVLPPPESVGLGRLEDVSRQLRDYLIAGDSEYVIEALFGKLPKHVLPHVSAIIGANDLHVTYLNFEQIANYCNNKKETPEAPMKFPQRVWAAFKKLRRSSTIPITSTPVIDSDSDKNLVYRLEIAKVDSERKNVALFRTHQGDFNPDRDALLVNPNFIKAAK